MDLISVIVPVYKVEPYLDRCVESIVNQTYKNLEIILVDDGSPDNCGAMCDAWAAKDSRIRVIHKENGGLSDARNAGMAVATGEYLAFVDSDDWLDITYVEHLYLLAQKYNAQIVACDVQIVFDETSLNATGSGSIVAYTPEEALKALIEGRTFRAVAWNKLYQKDLFIGECYPVGKNHEDEFTTFRLIDKAQQLIYFDKTLYYYRQRPNSIMNTYSIKRLDALDAYLMRISLWKEKYPKLYVQDKVTFCKSCVMFYQDALDHQYIPLQDIKKKLQLHRKAISFSLSEFLSLQVRDMIFVVGSGIFLQPFSYLLRICRG